MQSISTEGGVGGTVLYLERGERHTITMYRGVGGGGNNKCYWLMELYSIMQIFLIGCSTDFFMPKFLHWAAAFLPFFSSCKCKTAS